MSKQELPSPFPPTNHPHFTDRRYPRTNVFHVMPVRRAKVIAPDDTMEINVATYLDPFAESDSHRVVARHPRWTQGLTVEVDEVQGIYKPSYTRGIYPADRVFRGRVVNNEDEVVPVVGVMHSKRTGWIGLDPEAVGTEELRTVADLKVRIGRLSTAAAEAHNEHYHRSLTFELDEGLFS